MGDNSKILIVEDDLQLREISAKLLKLKGYQICEAEDRDQALRIIEDEENINTLILDLTMPGMTIDDFLSHVSSVNNDMKVIFSSGQPQESVKKYLNNGCEFRFLSKPYGIDELHQVLDHSDCSNAY